MCCVPPPQCHFPQLRKLAVEPFVGPPAHVSLSGVSFIEAHPTIEDLRWFPPPQAVLAPGSLPALARLETTNDMATSILLDPLTRPRPLKELVGLVADSTTVERLKGTTVAIVETLRLASFDELHSVSKLGAIFPALKSLFAPPFATSTDPHDFTRCYYPEVCCVLIPSRT
jgi:hypothetical protein